MPPIQALSDREVADWWDALAVWQRARWLGRRQFGNITAAQFAWHHLTRREQSDIWILRQRELVSAKETHEYQN